MKWKKLVTKFPSGASRRYPCWLSQSSRTRVTLSAPARPAAGASFLLKSIRDYLKRSPEIYWYGWDMRRQMIGDYGIWLLKDFKDRRSKISRNRLENNAVPVSQYPQVSPVLNIGSATCKTSRKLNKMT